MKTRFFPILSLLSLGIIISCNNKKSSETPELNKPIEKLNDSLVPPSVEDSLDFLYPLPDISPMDMCYLPVDYTKLKMTNAISTPPFARVIYSRPHLQGRKLFEGIIKYGEPWRLGANESTEIDLYKDAIIQGKKMKAGRYVLYCIPEASEWTIIFNTNTDSWGLRPDASKDVARFKVPVQTIKTRLEYFTMAFSGNPKSAELVMAWENSEARLPIAF